MVRRSNLAKYHSHVKWNICNELKEKTSSISKLKVLDIAIGRGGDIFKYIDSFGNLDTLVGFDIDKEAIDEAKNRLASCTKDLSTKHIHLSVASGLDDAAQLLNKEIRPIMKNCKFDLIICNFALHYFGENEERLQNILNFINLCAKKKTLVWFTFPDGLSLIDLCKKYKTNHIHNDVYSVSLPKFTPDTFPAENTSAENSSSVSAVEFQPVEFQPVEYKLNHTVYFDKAKPGEKIMTGGTSLEYLLIPDTITTKLSNFALQSSEHFDKWFDEFGSKHLSENEKEISETNISMIFMKK